MTKDYADKVRSILAGLNAGSNSRRVSGPYNDFNDNDQWYLRIVCKGRSFLLRGVKKLKILEVGLGENKISWKKLYEDSDVINIKQYLWDITR